jgi:hypothetical protein
MLKKSVFLIVLFVLCSSFVLGETIPPTISFETPTPTGTINTDSMTITTSSSDANDISTFIDFDNSLVAWWRFDDFDGSIISDSSGNGNIGSLVGNSVIGSNFGHLGDGLELPGANDIVVVPDSPSLDTISNGLTICLWQNSNSANGVGGSIIGKRIAGSDDAWQLTGDNGGLHFMIWIGGVGTAISKPASNVIGSWSHSCATFDGNQMKLYSDSLFVGSKALIGSIDITNDPVHIGRSYSSSYAYNGKLDDVMVFNKALSQGEITALYLGTSPKSLTKSFTNLGEGSHTFKAYSQDTSGNVGSVERTVIIDLITAQEVIDKTEQWVEDIATVEEVVTTIESYSG